MPVAEAELVSLGLPDGFTADEDVAQETTAVVPSGPSKPNKPIVGIIYPPPEVRNIVDKTASFVARNGPEFESRIRQNEQNNPKFNFLNSGDPYHAYYQHKVKEIQEGKSSTSSSQQATIPGEGKIISLIDEAKKKKQSELLKQVELPFVPKDPPTEFEFIADPPSISALDLDVVKLTAQFVARNGRQFLSSLMTREQRNYQFDFLRPQHSLFQYFTKLLEQYTKVLIPPKDIAKKLAIDDRKKVLDDVKYRANWIKHQEAQKRKEEEEAEKERLAYASIDWHDFVVVETVDYQQFEQGNFPPPTTPQEVGARVLLQDRILQGQTNADASNVAEEPLTAQDDTEVQDMEEDSSSSDDDDEQQPPMPPEPSDQGEKPPLPPTLEPPRQDKVLIKKDYDPKQSKQQVKEVIRPIPPEEYTISPITGERIPVSKLQEHMRIGLLDPRWKDQRDRQLMEKLNQESVFAPGTDIDDSLKQLAERRSDIFGIGVEETPIGKKAGEEDKERIPGMPWNPTLSSSQPPLMPPGGEPPSDEPKKDAIGPSMEPAQPPMPPPQQQPPQPPMGLSHHHPSQNPGPPGIPQPPPSSHAPNMPPMPGIVRPMGGMPGMPPGGPPPPPGVMLMQNLGQMRPLLGIPQPGFPPFPPGPPGTLPNRPPLLTSNPPVAPPVLPNLLPPPPQQPPPSAGGPPSSTAPPGVSSSQPAPPATSQQDDEPPTKKSKNLEDSLIPEGQFLATHSSPATFKILCQSMPEKPELNLQGQMITVTLALTDSISALKARIQETIGLAPGKQKLRLTEGLFFKDQNSLAFYNVGDGETIHLSLKERGGRKK
ncbi:Splicing factor 3A subunit 1 [Orchesella cincta]|uniref:Splicing factor 3A subunit 1 n=1 Tax=Orchesella cincta TaxID=48709 RepID=A0A1D2MRR6_ORCCI|nr:Splicing factor 3A subunit 1 [Orchesella cincta]